MSSKPTPAESGCCPQCPVCASGLHLSAAAPRSPSPSAPCSLVPASCTLAHWPRSGRWSQNASALRLVSSLWRSYRCPSWLSGRDSVRRRNEVDYRWRWLITPKAKSILVTWYLIEVFIRYEDARGPAYFKCFYVVLKLLKFLHPLLNDILYVVLSHNQCFLQPHNTEKSIIYKWLKYIIAELHPF